MAKDTKIIHVEVVDGEPQQIKVLSKYLKEVKEKLNFDAEFIITNGKIKFRDAKWLIEELYSVMKRDGVKK